MTADTTSETTPPPPTSFSYDDVDPATADRMRAWEKTIGEHREAIRGHWHEIGKTLIEAKVELAHGTFTDWVTKQLNIDIRSAEMAMRAVEKVTASPKSEALKKLSLRAVDALHAEGVPEEAREEVIERVEGGEHISGAKAKEIIIRVKSMTAEEAMKAASMPAPPSMPALPSMPAKGEPKSAKAKPAKATPAKSSGKSKRETAAERKEREERERDEERELAWRKLSRSFRRSSRRCRPNCANSPRAF